MTTERQSFERATSQNRRMLTAKTYTFPSIFFSIFLRKCTPGWRGCKIACKHCLSVWPHQYLFSLGSWEKYSLVIHLKKIIIPPPFHSKAFVVLTNLRQTGRYLADEAEPASFFANSGAYYCKHFKQLFKSLSGLGLLTMWKLPRWVSYVIYSLLWNYVSYFMQDFWSSHRFLPSKPSFLHVHFTTAHSNFASFLAFSTTYKPINRSIHAYGLTYM